jgi:hypothetical protein
MPGPAIVEAAEEMEREAREWFTQSTTRVWPERPAKATSVFVFVCRIVNEFPTYDTEAIGDATTAGDNTYLWGKRQSWKSALLHRK